MTDNKSSKIYFVKLIIFALVIAATVFVYFQMQPPVYKSSGKFSISNEGSSDSLNIYGNVSVNLTSTVTEGIKSRLFVEQMLKDANVTYTAEEINQVDSYISAEVIKDSNIITVEIKNRDKNALNVINDHFLQTLRDSQIINSQYPAVTVQVVDPLFTSSKPFSPKPLKYAAITFVAIFFVGSLFYYSFLSPDDYFISEGF